MDLSKQVLMRLMTVLHHWGKGQQMKNDRKDLINIRKISSISFITAGGKGYRKHSGRGVDIGFHQMKMMHLYVVLQKQPGRKNWDRNREWHQEHSTVFLTTCLTKKVCKHFRQQMSGNLIGTLFSVLQQTTALHSLDIDNSDFFKYQLIGLL